MCTGVHERVAFTYAICDSHVKDDKCCGQMRLSPLTAGLVIWRLGKVAGWVALCLAAILLVVPASCLFLRGGAVLSISRVRTVARLMGELFDGDL